MITFENLFYKHISIKNAPTYYPDHLESGYEFLIFINGDASFNIDGDIYELHPWDLVIIPPSTYHHLVVHNNSYYERILITFDITQNDDKELGKILENTHVINIKDCPPLVNVVSRLHEYSMLFSEKDYNEVVKILFSEFLMLLKTSDWGHSATTVESNPIIKKLLNLIALNYEKNVPIKFFADQMYLSESYIKNLFSSTMHIGLKHYINNLRILKAQFLIKQGARPSDVYLQCGFESYPTFLRQYKHFTGKNPSEELLDKKTNNNKQ